jgi:hypothetical protein
MKKTPGSPNKNSAPVCSMCVKPDVTRPMASNEGQRLKPETPRRKGWWARYVARLKKHESDIRSCCH